MNFVICEKCRQNVPEGNFCDQCGAVILSNNSLTSPSITLLHVEGGNVKLILKPNTIIGRTQGDYIDQLKDYKYISGKHALVSYSESQGWKITDLGSTNGTYVNDDRLAKNVPHIFKKGDIIDLGSLIFEVV